MDMKRLKSTMWNMLKQVIRFPFVERSFERVVLIEYLSIGLGRRRKWSQGHQVETVFRNVSRNSEFTVSENGRQSERSAGLLRSVTFSQWEQSLPWSMLRQSDRFHHCSLQMIRNILLFPPSPAPPPPPPFFFFFYKYLNYVVLASDVRWWISSSDSEILFYCWLRVEPNNIYRCNTGR